MTDFDHDYYTVTGEKMEHETAEEAIGAYLYDFCLVDPVDIGVATALRSECPIRVFGWDKVPDAELDAHQRERLEIEGWDFLTKNKAERDYSADECEAIMREDYPELFR